jgi:hypothetical protein
MPEEFAPRAPAPSHQPAARAPAPSHQSVPRAAPISQPVIARGPAIAPAPAAAVAARPAAPAPAANVPAATAAPAAAQAVASEYACNEDESRRLLMKFAGSHLPSNKPPEKAGVALLEQLAKLLQRAGLTVTRNANGTVHISNGNADTVMLFEEGLFGTIKRDRKSFPALPIVWNPFEKKFEGTLPGEVEFRIPRRSALAVLTEVVLQRLSAVDDAR